MAGGIDLIAIGGNAIIPADGDGTIDEQRRTTRNTMKQVSDLIGSGRNVILTHGNGPIVGNILERNDAAKDHIPPMPLDVCGADSQGGIGYMIQQMLRNELRTRGISKDVVSIVSQVIVDEEDDAFENPTKPIGPFYSKLESGRLASQKSWIMKEDAGGRGYRRVVPSPTPLEIVEADVIASLMNMGVVVIAAGGGGIPVIVNDGELEGVEAVIDKDRAASVLAKRVGVERLIILTDVEVVFRNWGKPDQKPIKDIKLTEMRQLYEAYEFPAGSMGPKVRAAIDFIAGGGKEAIISRVDSLLAACRGVKGTHILPD